MFLWKRQMIVYFLISMCRRYKIIYLPGITIAVVCLGVCAGKSILGIFSLLNEQSTTTVNKKSFTYFIINQDLSDRNVLFQSFGYNLLINFILTRNSVQEIIIFYFHNTHKNSNTISNITFITN